MSLFVDMNQEETYRSLMDYFTGRRMKILESREPSFIRAEMGNWISLEFASEKGEVEASVSKRNGGCYVNLNFNFYKTYLALIPVMLVGLIIILILATIWSWSTEEIMGVGGFLMSLAFVLVITLLSHSVSSTKRRFIEELGSFLRSISASMKHQTEKL